MVEKKQSMCSKSLEIAVKIIISVLIVIGLNFFDGRASIFFYLSIGVITLIIMNMTTFIEVKKYICCHWLSTVITCFGITFSLVGNKMFIYPVEGEALYYRILCFGILFIILIIPSVSVLRLLDNQVYTRNSDSNYKTLDRKWYFIILFAGFVTVEIAYLIAFLPGVVSWDDWNVIAEAKGLFPRREYEGLFYIFTRYILLNIVDSVTFITIVQIIFTGTIFSLIGSYFIYTYDRKVKYQLQIALALFLMLLPNNALMSITLTKDTFWAVSFVWLIYCVARISRGDDSRALVAEYVIASLLVWLVRQNGKLVVPATAISLGIIAIKKQRKRIIYSTLGLIICIFISEIGLRSVSYEPTMPGMKYIAAFQDLLGVYYTHGNVDSDTKAMIENVIDEEFAQKYNPYWAEYETWRDPLGEISTAFFLKNYINTFLHNPLKTIKAILLRQDMLWDIQLGVNGTETWQWWTEFGSTRWPDLIPPRKSSKYLDIIDSIGKWSVKSGSKEWLWRCGISLQICLICLVVTIRNRRNIIHFIPFISLWVFFVLGLGWAHYRYFWCMWLASLIYLGFNFNYCEKCELSEQDEK